MFRESLREAKERIALEEERIALEEETKQQEQWIRRNKTIENVKITLDCLVYEIVKTICDKVAEEYIRKGAVSGLLVDTPERKVISDRIPPEAMVTGITLSQAREIIDGDGKRSGFGKLYSDETKQSEPAIYLCSVRHNEKILPFGKDTDLCFLTESGFLVVSEAERYCKAEGINIIPGALVKYRHNLFSDHPKGHFIPFGSSGRILRRSFDAYSASMMFRCSIF